MRPGTALPPDQLTPEAARYEALLQGEDTDEKRRQFDDRLVHVGANMGMEGSRAASPTASLILEVDVGNRLVLGTEATLSLWGPGAGVYLRGRPLVWGGRGRGLLNALTVQAGYRYMTYGDDPFGGLWASMCHSDCDRPSFVTMPVHFVGLEAGFEHSFARGLTLRYAWGAALQLVEPAWRCHIGRSWAACGEERPPSATLFVSSVTLSYALF